MPALPSAALSGPPAALPATLLPFFDKNDPKIGPRAKAGCLGCLGGGLQPAVRAVQGGCGSDHSRGPRAARLPQLMRKPIQHGLITRFLMKNLLNSAIFSPAKLGTKGRYGTKHPPPPRFLLRLDPPGIYFSICIGLTTRAPGLAPPPG